MIGFTAKWGQERSRTNARKRGQVNIQALFDWQKGGPENKESPHGVWGSKHYVDLLTQVHTFCFPVYKIRLYFHYRHWTLLVTVIDQSSHFSSQRCEIIIKKKKSLVTRQGCFF